MTPSVLNRSSWHLVGWLVPHFEFRPIAGDCRGDFAAFVGSVATRQWPLEVWTMAQFKYSPSGNQTCKTGKALFLNGKIMYQCWITRSSLFESRWDILPLRLFPKDQKVNNKSKKSMGRSLQLIGCSQKRSSSLRGEVFFPRYFYEFPLFLSQTCMIFHVLKLPNLQLYHRGCCMPMWSWSSLALFLGRNVGVWGFPCTKQQRTYKLSSKQLHGKLQNYLSRWCLGIKHGDFQFSM